MRIAVVGAGISGLAAYALQGTHHVTLYEADWRLGGHTHTFDVTLDGITYPVDTGFLVYTSARIRGLIRLFAELAVRTAKSDMSFGLSDRAARSKR